jgi:DNA-binding transcriptional ArsR family regulator
VITAANAERVGAVFAALGDPTRREVLERLSASDTLSITGLTDGLPISRQAVAKHLAILERAGLVESTRTGRESRYRLHPDPMSDAAAWMAHIGAQWDSRLARLQELLNGPPPT